MKRLLIAVLTLLGIIAAGVAAVLMTVPGAIAAPAGRTATQNCTPAYGMCEVTFVRHHRHNGTVWVETCFAQPPVKPGASNVWIAVVDCYRP